MNENLRTNRVKRFREGCIYKTNQYGDLIILQYESATKVRVRFLETGYETTTSMPNIVASKVKDWFAKTVCGVGVVGEKVSKINGEYPKEYILWRNMLKRCYDKSTISANKTYEGCSVSEEFKFYPYFKWWCKNQIGFGQEGWQLDKDILNPQSKRYSPEHCVFVPVELNSLTRWNKTITNESLIGVKYNKQLGKFYANIISEGVKKHLGVFNTRLETFLAYKEAKELAMKKAAEKWKNQIDPRVYEALMNYQVEIID